MTNRSTRKGQVFHEVKGISINVIMVPRSPGTHIVGPWVIDSISSYRDLRTGTQYIGIWASRE